MTGILPITDENLALARAAVMEGWRARAAERGGPAPEDLSGSCKFSSLFASKLFGLKMAGNSDHQFCLRPDGEVLDLNRDAADVRALTDPHRHDPSFWRNRDHRASMRSCEPRVDLWLERFRQAHFPAASIQEDLSP